jgi:predicted aconitase with swiveling domain
VDNVIKGRVLVEGDAAGLALWSDKSLSFWGGYDQYTGEIIDRRHPLSGKVGTNRVIAIPHTKGSSTTTAVLLESVRQGKSPAAVITTGMASFLALASIVADELYGRNFPVVMVAEEDFTRIESGQWITVNSDGVIEISPGPQSDSFS